MRHSIIWTVVFVSMAMTVTEMAVWGGEIQVPEAPTTPSFTLPALNGPYSVGVRSFAWVDEAREETATPKDGDHREVAVQIWYPSTVKEEDAKALYSPDLETILAASTDLPAGEQRFVKMHAPLLNTATNSVPGAAIATSTQPWPVILFSPGGNVSRHGQTALAERIASQGFVLVSMSHPYSTIDVAPQSGFSMSIDWGLDLEDADAARAADDRLANILAGDATFVLKQLRRIGSDVGAFAGALNLKQVGIAGHSRGGTTVGRACGSNPDFVACAVIDNIGPERERETGVQPPWLTLRSPWGPERIAALHDFLGRTGSVAYDLELGDSNHFTCTDMPLFFEDLRLEGVDPAGGIEACANVLLSFFDAYLKRRLSTDNEWSPPSGLHEVTIKRFWPSSP